MWPTTIEADPVLKNPTVTKVLSVKEKVALAFQDQPRMVKIIGECESHFKQFKTIGTSTKPNISPTGDVGVMQINIKTWSHLAKKLDLDIFGSVDDNITMGRIVYEQQGISAWTCNHLV